jgi:hypothetical protein
VVTFRVQTITKQVTCDLSNFFAFVKIVENATPVRGPGQAPSSVWPCLRDPRMKLRGAAAGRRGTSISLISSMYPITRCRSFLSRHIRRMAETAAWRSLGYKVRLPVRASKEASSGSGRARGNDLRVDLETAVRQELVKNAAKYPVEKAKACPEL